MEGLNASRCNHSSKVSEVNLHGGDNSAAETDAQVSYRSQTCDKDTARQFWQSKCATLRAHMCKFSRERFSYEGLLCSLSSH